MSSRFWLEIEFARTRLSTLLLPSFLNASWVGMELSELLALTMKKKIVIWPSNSQGQLIFWEVSRLFNE